jgi:hypothetical protein
MEISQFVELNIEEINRKITDFNNNDQYSAVEIKKYLNSKIYEELLTNIERQEIIMTEFAEMNYVKSRVKELANRHIYYYPDLLNFLKQYIFNELNEKIFDNNIIRQVEDTIFNNVNIEERKLNFIANDFKKLLFKSLFVASMDGFSSNILNVESGVMTANAGDSAQFLFLSRAILAGYNSSNVDVRSSRYDAIIDYKGVLLKVQVKGISSDVVSFKDRDRGGRGIDHTHERNRGRRITSRDCDIYVAVDKQVGICYIIPMNIIDTWDDQSIISVNTRELEEYKENWKIIDNMANGRI